MRTSAGADRRKATGRRLLYLLAGIVAISAVTLGVAWLALGTVFRGFPASRAEAIVGILAGVGLIAAVAARIGQGSGRGSRGRKDGE